MRLDRVLIVDDEPPARRRLARMLRELGELGEVLEANSVAAAAAVIAAAPAIDCIFLDVQMPIDDGFALFARCVVIAPVIFVTAYHQHAVRAFEVNALDYLLKPVALDRLADAVRRLEATPRRPAAVLAADDVVWLRERGRQAFLPVDDIVNIAAADDYTEIHLVDGTSRLCSLTMRDWETRLPPTFVRIHRSMIAASAHVHELRHVAGGATITLRGTAQPLRVARGRLPALKALLDERARLQALGCK